MPREIDLTAMGEAIRLHMQQFDPRPLHEYTALMAVDCGCYGDATIKAASDDEALAWFSRPAIAYDAAYDVDYSTAYAPRIVSLENDDTGETVTNGIDLEETYQDGQIRELGAALRDLQGIADNGTVRALWQRNGEVAHYDAVLNRVRKLVRNL